MVYSQDLAMEELLLTNAHSPEICLALLAFHNDPVTALEREDKKICFIRNLLRNLSHDIFGSLSLHLLMVARCKPVREWFRLKSVRIPIAHY